jgi:hypothetical protein
MSSENPYAPPEISEPLTPATPLEKVRAAHATVKWVSTVMVVTASLNLLFGVLGLISLLLEKRSSNEEQIIIIPFLTGYFIGSFLTAGFVIASALRLRYLQNHGWGMFAALVMSLPCLGLFWIFNFPIGVWALYVLQRPHIKAAFYAVKHDNILLRDS